MANEMNYVITNKNVVRVVTILDGFFSRSETVKKVTPPESIDSLAQLRYQRYFLRDFLRFFKRFFEI